MKDIIENIFGFLYTLSMGDYIFFIGTFLIILAFIYILYLIKREDELNNNKNDDMTYLEDTIKSLEKDYKPKTIELTDYEKEQEESAIISYQELVNNKNKFTVNYDEEYVSNIDDVEVKKINLDKTSNNRENNEKIEVKLLNYDEYEEFLSTLKQLQKKLIN